MRDDLHRTVSVSRPLRRVLQYASRQADHRERLPRAIEEAVRVALRTQIRSPWLDVVRTALGEGGADLFPEHRIGDAVRQLSGLAVTPLEREVMECIRAQATFRGVSSSLLADAMRVVAKRVEERSCEQLSSIVGGKNEAEVRKILSAARPLCQAQELIDAAGSVIANSRLPGKGVELDEIVAP